jgi:glucose-6-phosphate isomerase
MVRYQDKSWQDSMRIRVDFNNMMTEAVADFGIDASEINELGDELAAAAHSMQDRRPEMKWRELPYTQDAIVEDILATVRGFLPWCENFVVLGIGGSALGPIAVQQALNHLHYNDLPKERRGGPRLFVEDNVDPERMAALLDVIDPAATVFNVITKSGGTSETMSQLLIIAALLRERVGDGELPRHLIATTDANKGNLIKIARRLGLKTFYVPDGVGGRAMQSGGRMEEPRLYARDAAIHRHAQGAQYFGDDAVRGFA